MRITSNLVAVSLTGVVLLGQTLAWNKSDPLSNQRSVARSLQDDITARGLFIRKRADAMRVKVLDVKTDAAVSLTQEFTTNDKLTVVIESNFEGYAYIVNVEIVNNGAKRFLLYPNPQTLNNRIKPDEPLALSVEFDKKPAIEALQVIVSHDRIDYLSAALKGQCSESENRCLLSSGVAARVASIVGDKDDSRHSETAGIFPRQSDPKQNQSGVSSRDIILAPGKDAGEKETYVAIPIKTGSDGRLQPNQVVVFEVRLKHV